MKARCKYPNTNGYEFYGGRGITYDPAWEKFENFLADMAKRPSKRHQLDRKDTDGNYTKNNCQWITRSANQRKKRVMKNNKSGYIGISYIKSRDKWLVQSRGTGKQIHLGIFTDLDKAIKKWKEYHNDK